LLISLLGHPETSHNSQQARQGYEYAHKGPSYR
jgi:hypothetical protein